MATVYDVAACIMEELGGRTTAMKLQKLVYYAQAWSLAWDEKPLFAEPIEAWSDGPVCRALYREHPRAYTVTSLNRGSSESLTEEQLRTIKAVVNFYGQHDAEWLSQLTHRETPWCDAREGIPERAPSKEPISIESMKKYYGDQARALGMVSHEKTAPAPQRRSPFSSYVTSSAYRTVVRKTFPKTYASTLDFLVNMPPEDLALADQDSGLSVADAVRWLETGEGDPCETSD